MKNDENYAREEENEKERTSSYRTYLEQKGQKTKMIPSYGLSILLFLVVCGLGFAAFQNSSENECDGDSTDADEQCKDDGNRDTDTGF